MFCVLVNSFPVVVNLFYLLISLAEVKKMLQDTKTIFRVIIYIDMFHLYFTSVLRIGIRNRLRPNPKLFTFQDLDPYADP